MSASDPDLQLPIALTLDGHAGPAARIPRDKLASMVATAMAEYDLVTPSQATHAAPTATTASAKLGTWAMAAGAAITLAIGAVAARYYLSEPASPPAAAPAAPTSPQPAETPSPQPSARAAAAATGMDTDTDPGVDGLDDMKGPGQTTPVRPGPSGRARAVVADKSRRGGATVPEDLLQKANQQRAAGRFGDAAQTYSLVYNRFPKTQAAYVARVAAGALELEHLSNPTRARLLFEQALAERPRGALDLEARQGLSVALRDLEDRAGERDALRRLVKGHPGSPAARRAQVRLRELGGE